MREKTDESPSIKRTMDDVAEAEAAVKRDLIGELPKMRRAGRTDVRRSATDTCRSAIGQPSGGAAACAQISSTTVCPESKAPTILSKDTENAASKSSFRQLPNRTHRNRPASCGWLLR